MEYDLKTFTFGKGSHKDRESGMCVMEAVAYLAGEKHSDKPACASPVITRLAIWLNDSCSDSLRQELLRDLPWRIVGTKASDEIEQQRAYMAADWAVRFVCPLTFRRAGLKAEARKLESMPVVDGHGAAEAAARAAAKAAARVADGAAEAAEAARAARSAARAAARAAAEAAAEAADGAAAEAAAGAAEAAWSAARAAARVADGAAEAAEAARAARSASMAAAIAVAVAAAWAAARAAAEDLEAIQRSLAGLLDKMIQLTEPKEAQVTLEKARA